MSELPLFVFGTLRQGEENHHYLAGHFERWLHATLPGYRRITAAHGFPSILPATGHAVAGELYFLRPNDYAATLAACDALEDIPPGQLAGDYYQRIEVAVDSEAGRFAAWAYAAP